MTTTSLTEAELKETQEVLQRAIDQLLREMCKTGGAGGTGRIQSYAPILVNLNWAMEVVNNYKEAIAPPQQATGRKGGQQ